jgi:hypothetical protein
MNNLQDMHGIISPECPSVALRYNTDTSKTHVCVGAGIGTVLVFETAKRELLV